MVAGDKWELTIPPSLGYGARGVPPKIPAHSVLLFELELLQVKPASAFSFFGFDLADPRTLLMLASVVLVLYQMGAFGGGAAKGPSVSLEEASGAAENPTVYFDVEIGGASAGRVEMMLFSKARDEGR